VAERVVEAMAAAEKPVYELRFWLKRAVLVRDLPCTPSTCVRLATAALAHLDACPLLYANACMIDDPVVLGRGIEAVEIDSVGTIVEIAVMRATTAETAAGGG
jgi:hypothetical protein